MFSSAAPTCDPALPPGPKGTPLPRDDAPMVAFGTLDPAPASSRAAFTPSLPPEDAGALLQPATTVSPALFRRAVNSARDASACDLRLPRRMMRRAQRRLTPSHFDGRSAAGSEPRANKQRRCASGALHRALIARVSCPGDGEVAGERVFRQRQNWKWEVCTGRVYYSTVSGSWIYFLPSQKSL